jgi:hypothetical protein
MSEFSEPPRLLYCHCQYAQVIPKEVKSAVLAGLSSSGTAFEAVADLCEMAARHDPSLKRLSACGPVKIAACFPRAVKGLFHQADADLDPASSEVLNMRALSAPEVLSRLLAPDLSPNLPVSSTSSATSQT